MKEGLHIAAELIEAMLQAARAAAPEECCGLLIGVIEPAPRVLCLMPAPNVHPEPRRFFEIDPKVQFTTLRALREGGGAAIMLGCYHSHPAGPAKPSARDLAEANDPDLVWLVIDPVAGEVAGFLPLADEQGRITEFEALPLLS
jgi:proteasome lid subunit RPN8/RPN11